MSPADAAMWNGLIESRCGSYFGPTRVHHLESCLWARMKDRGAASYDEYYNYIVFNPRGEREWLRLLERLVNRETSFFRHAPTFEALEREVLPRIMGAKQRLGRNDLTFWSAACSTGDEAYSMAMVARSATSGGTWNVSVRGSDISTTSLERCQRGRYPPRVVANVPGAYRRRFLKLIEEGREPEYEINGGIRSLVRFEWCNLTQPETLGGKTHDVIFCQNALLYFRPERRQQVVESLAGRLRPHGYLFLGPGEVVGLRLPGTEMLHLGDSLVYQQVS